MEVWKDIEGYEGVYQVSTNGVVRSFGRMVLSRRLNNRFYTPKKGSVLRPSLNTVGYYTVGLSKGDGTKRKRCLVHRLVAIAFIPNPDCKPSVNHKNAVRTDNKLENLEWVTPYENTKHAKLKGLCRPSTPLRFTKEQADVIIQMYRTSNKTQQSIADMFNVTQSVISNIVHGKYFHRRRYLRSLHYEHG